MPKKQQKTNLNLPPLICWMSLTWNLLLLPLKNRWGPQNFSEIQQNHVDFITDINLQSILLLVKKYLLFYLKKHVDGSKFSSVSLFAMVSTVDMNSTIFPSFFVLIKDGEQNQTNSRKSIISGKF